jgi:hypothetical protein
MAVLETQFRITGRDQTAQATQTAAANLNKTAQAAVAASNTIKKASDDSTRAAERNAQRLRRLADPDSMFGPLSATKNRAEGIAEAAKRAAERTEKALVAVTTGTSENARRQVATAVDATRRASQTTETVVTASATRLTALRGAMIGAVGGLAAGVASGLATGAIDTAKQMYKDFADYEALINRAAERLKIAPRDLSNSIREHADRYGVLITDIEKQLHQAMQEGFRIEAIYPHLDRLLHVHRLTGDSILEIYRGASQAASNFEMPFPRALEMMANAAEKGNMNFAQMNQAMPGLSSKITAFGERGEAAFSRLLAVMVESAKGSDNIKESLSGLEKVLNDALEGRNDAFKKHYGQDLEEFVKQTKRRNGDLLQNFVDTLNRAIEFGAQKGHTISEVLDNIYGTDTAAKNVALNLIKAINGEIHATQRELRGVHELPSIKNKLDEELTSLNRLSNAWGEFGRSVANMAISLGVDRFLEGLARAVNGIGDAITAVKVKLEDFSSTIGRAATAAMPTNVAAAFSAGFDVAIGKARELQQWIRDNDNLLVETMRRWGEARAAAEASGVPKDSATARSTDPQQKGPLPSWPAQPVDEPAPTLAPPPEPVPPPDPTQPPIATPSRAPIRRRDRWRPPAETLGGTPPTSDRGPDAAGSATERTQRGVLDTLRDMWHLAKTPAVGRPNEPEGQVAGPSGSVEARSPNALAPFRGGGSASRDRGGFESNAPAASVPSMRYGGGAGGRGGGGRGDRPFQGELAPAAGGPVQEALGVNQQQWDTYRRTMAGIESQGRYGITGGSSGRFSGAYQFGAAEIRDTARRLGEPAPTREQFLNDPAMQERFLGAYTRGHHDYLMKNSPEYQSASPERKLAILGYAHNQGAGGAAKWLRSGRAGSDAFGTSGTRYSSAIERNLRGGADQAPRASVQENLEVLKKVTTDAEKGGAHITSTFRGHGHELTKANPRSAHAQGRAFDVRAQTAEQADAAIAAQKERFARMGLEHGTHYTYRDEVRHPMPWTKGPHVHFQLTPAGVAKLRGQDGKGGAADSRSAGEVGDTTPLKGREISPKPVRVPVTYEYKGAEDVSRRGRLQASREINRTVRESRRGSYSDVGVA